MRRSLAAALMLAGGCRAAPPPAVTHAGPANNRLPTIALRHISTTIESSPSGLSGEFRIGPSGLLVNQYDAGDGMLFSVIDSTGTVIRRVGRSGEGPGEIRGGGLVDLSDSAFVIAGLNARLSRFSLTGQLLESSRATEVMSAHVAASDHEVLGVTARKEGWFPAIGSTRTGSVRQLVATDDSFIRSTFPAGALLRDGSVSMPVVGLWPGGFFAGDGFKYRLALYSWDGRLQSILARDLPPSLLSAARVEQELKQNLTILESRRGKFAAADVQRLRDEAARRVRPYFRHNTLSTGLDSQGRIWIVGLEADSGYADLFNSTRFLGRLHLPCAGFDAGWSLKGTWLALACAPADPAFDGDAVFKVFRIID